ncbi:dodecin family protein [bacterium]|nr:dodecin family protein [bacterium]
MQNSIYKQIKIIGSSTISWEDAANNAIAKAGEKIKDMRVAEVVRKDIRFDAAGIMCYRTKLTLSFKILDL